MHRGWFAPGSVLCVTLDTCAHFSLFLLQCKTACGGGGGGGGVERGGGICWILEQIPGEGAGGGGGGWIVIMG